MRRFLNGLYLLCGVLSAILIVAICGLVFVQVVFNFIVKMNQLITGTGVGLSISSYSDIAGYMLAGASFLALPYTFQKGGHIRMTLIHHTVGARGRLVLEFLCVIIAGAAAMFLTYDLGKLTYDSIRFDDVSEGIVKINLWIPQATMTFGMAMFSVGLIDALCQLLFKGVAIYEVSETETELESSYG